MKNWRTTWWEKSNCVCVLIVEAEFDTIDNGTSQSQLVGIFQIIADRDAFGNGADDEIFFILHFFEDIKGFCKSAKIEEIREHEYVLTPGRYVGIEDVEQDGIPFEEKMENMTAELAELFAKSRHLEDEIRKNLGGIGYEF